MQDKSQPDPGTITKSQPDPGAITITPADGYQYGDDHAWDAQKQAGLVGELSELIMKFDAEH
jgi:hypothetical protein